MKTITKKSLCFLIGLFILFSFYCYADETLTDQQEKSEEWFTKGYNADNLTLQVEYYTKAIELDPSFADAYYFRGRAYDNMDEHHNAVNDYIRATVFHSFWYFNFIHGITYTILDRYKKAIADCNKIIETNPEDVNAYYLRGITYTILDRDEEAIEDCNKIIETNPEDVNAYYLRGIIYANLGEYEEAVEDCSKTIEINPELAFAYYFRGYNYYNFGQYEKAIEDASKTIEIDPEFAFSYFLRGRSYDSLGEYRKTIIDDYSKTIEIYPEFSDAYYFRGRAYDNFGEHEKAIEDYSKTIEIYPEDADAHLARGIDYSLLQEFPTVACGDFYQAGVSFLKDNNITQALMCVDHIKKVDPSSPLIKKLMDKIYP